MGKKTSPFSYRFFGSLDTYSFSYAIAILGQHWHWWYHCSTITSNGALYYRYFAEYSIIVICLPEN